MAPTTPRQAQAAGMSRSSFYRAAEDGRLERIARGIYLPMDSEADWDWVEAATRRPNATVCLASALVHHDLTDDIPSALHVALPRGSRTPASSPSITWHQCDRDTFDLGRSEMTIPGTEQKIGIYNPERTITDAFRLRGDVGYEMARDALAEWLRRDGSPATMMSMAMKLPRAKRPVLTALEMLSRPTAGRRSDESRQKPGTSPVSIPRMV
ncbi:MAG: type IV toxin-antitoxin system AbiEi family antitoxin domain-containing protein [Arachnia sp.]